jgi:hypothetical protein
MVDRMSYNPAVSPSSFQFGVNAQVPAGGSIQLEGPGTTTTGFVLSNKGIIVGGSIGVSNSPSANDYNLEIRVNGVTVATVALVAGQVKAFANLSVAVVAGDVVTAFMVRTSGSGGSTFNNQQAIVQISNISNVT